MELLRRHEAEQRMATRCCCEWKELWKATEELLLLVKKTRQRKTLRPRQLRRHWRLQMPQQDCCESMQEELE